jgi:cytochrome c556
MRIALFAAAALVSLSACGGPEASQANNAQAHIGEDASAPPAANASLVQTRVNKGNAAAIMHERHEGMEAIAKANKALRRELDKSSPNLAVVRSSAARIAALSQKASGWFPSGTGPEVGKTGAKPAIWQNPKDFAAKLRNFQVAARAFNGVAASGDVEAIKAYWADLGGACKACHDKYRTEMHH